MAKSTFFTAEEIAILIQRGKAAWNNLTEEQKAEHIAKSKANNHKAAMTPEERAEASRKGKEAWANLSDEEKAARVAKAKAGMFANI